jgi:hypothetical protein
MKGCFLLLLGLLPLFGLQASGRAYIILDTNDTAKITSLRGAIIDANQRQEESVIMLGRATPHQKNQQWIFHLTISGADEDNARTGDLDITRSGPHGDIRHTNTARGNLTIIGAVSNVTIDATRLGDRVFQILPGAQLTLENLTIIGGTAPGNGDRFLVSGEAGGAIYNAGTLLLEDCIITNNTSGGGNFPEGNAGGTDGGDGGAIYNSGMLTMNNCIVAGNSSGNGADGASGGNGGGIDNDGTCILTESVVRGNQSGAGGNPEGNAFGFAGSGGNGAGIYNAGMMTLNSCIISNNISGAGKNGGQPGIISVNSVPGAPGGNGGDGAGIYNSGNLSLNFSTINGNVNSDGGAGGPSVGIKDGDGGGGGSGAGIFNAGLLSLNTCTISGNNNGSGGHAGAGWPAGGDGGRGGSGGGIFNSGYINMLSCTIVGNACGDGGVGGFSNESIFGDGHGGTGGDGGSGGGIYVTDSTIANLRNNLIALNRAGVGGVGGSILGNGTDGNSGFDGGGFDVAGDFTSQGFNLISIGDDSTGFTSGMNADQVGNNSSPIDPLIGPLQMNGGSTPTHALLPNSPAIDQGNSFGIHTDQRGHKRPQNFLSIPNATQGDESDIGAFELDSN